MIDRTGAMPACRDRPRARLPLGQAAGRARAQQQGGDARRHRAAPPLERNRHAVRDAGRDNTYARSDLGLQVEMTDALALKAGYEVRHNTDTAPGIERTDSLTTLNLVYGF
jgi:hypothetical protein